MTAADMKKPLPNGRGFFMSRAWRKSRQGIAFKTIAYTVIAYTVIAFRGIAFRVIARQAIIQPRKVRPMKVINSPPMMEPLNSDVMPLKSR